jgi:hypothetical protein
MREFVPMLVLKNCPQEPILQRSTVYIMCSMYLDDFIRGILKIELPEFVRLGAQGKVFFVRPLESISLK